MKKVYSSFGITLGVFLGGPLAGAYFIAKNYDQFGAHEASKTAIRIGLIITLAVFASLLLLPENIIQGIPNFILPVIFVVASRYLVDKYQKDQLEEFINSGGSKESNWKVVGISLVIAFGTVFAAIVMALLADLFKA